MGIWLSLIVIPIIEIKDFTLLTIRPGFCEILQWFMPGLVIFEKSYKAFPPSHYRALKMQGHNNNIGSNSNRVNSSDCVTTQMNALQAEKQTTADQRRGSMATPENMQSSVLSASRGALPELIFPSTESLPSAGRLYSSPASTSKAFFSTCALATVVI